MKAIVVRQPWATLIALGIETTETRPAPPNGPMRPDGVRGLPGLAVERGERIAIVAGASVPPDAVSFGGWTVWRWGTGAKMDRRGVHEVTGDEIDLPLGAVVCTAVVADALPITDEMRRPGRHIWLLRPEYPMVCEPFTPGEMRPMHGIEDELTLGDFTPGRWGWMLTDVQPCDPIPCKGQQGVFRLPADVTEAITPEATNTP